MKLGVVNKIFACNDSKPGHVQTNKTNYSCINFFFQKNIRVFFTQSIFKQSKTSFEKNCFSAWASTLNMGLINKVDMVCLSPVGYGV